MLSVPGYIRFAGRPSNVGLLRILIVVEFTGHTALSDDRGSNRSRLEDLGKMSEALRLWFREAPSQGPGSAPKSSLCQLGAVKGCLVPGECTCALDESRTRSCDFRFLYL